MLNEIRSGISSRLFMIADDSNQFQINISIKDIEKLINDVFGSMDSFLLTSVEGLAASEIEFTRRLMNEVITAELTSPSIEDVMRSILTQSIGGQVGASNLLLAEAIDQFTDKKRTELLNTINDGFLLGKPSKEIAKDVADLTGNRLKHQSESLTRTIINHTSSQVKRAFNMANSGIVEGYIWVAVLDSRTTLLCAGRDQRFYSLGSNIYPPAHFNCRSTTITKFNDDITKKFPASKKSSETGKVNAKMTFDSWLRKQPASMQDEYFSQFKNGDEMAKLFRRGKLPIQKFRNELGVVYSLDELRSIDPIAFARSGVGEPLVGGSG